MPKVKEIVLKTGVVRSLVWEQGGLIDWVSGGRFFNLNGEISEPTVRYGYPFDAAASSPSGEYAVIYTRLGTKGLVLRRGKVIREINRSFYHADVYDFPIVLFRTKSGREAIAHCPEEYNRIEFDDLESGVRLTVQEERKPSDFFHSRLSVSQDGSYLLSAGWIWHPVDAVKVFNIETALSQPEHLDGAGVELGSPMSETGASASFVDKERVVVTLNADDDPDADPDSPPDLSPRKIEIRVYDLVTRATPLVRYPTEQVGNMMDVGHDHVLGLYHHPKLISLATGQVAQEWPHIRSGTQLSSIVANGIASPPIAFDSTSRQCAIAYDAKISVLQFED
jgi:hypothetical protein